MGNIVSSYNPLRPTTPPVVRTGEEAAVVAAAAVASAQAGGKQNVLKSSKRLQSEIVELNRGLYPTITAGPSEDNLFKWTGTIQGPKGSPYEGGLFVLDISIPSTYPFNPPKIKFRTKIYHCNIDDRGQICLDILNKEKWSPALTIPGTLLSISSLLTDANPDSALRLNIAQLLRSNRREHDRVAREWTLRFAKPA